MILRLTGPEAQAAAITTDLQRQGYTVRNPYAAEPDALLEVDGLVLRRGWPQDPTVWTLLGYGQYRYLYYYDGRVLLDMNRLEGI